MYRPICGILSIEFGFYFDTNAVWVYFMLNILAMKNILWNIVLAIVAYLIFQNRRLKSLKINVDCRQQEHGWLCNSCQKWWKLWRRAEWTVDLYSSEKAWAERRWWWLCIHKRSTWIRRRNFRPGATRGGVYKHFP